LKWFQQSKIYPNSWLFESIVFHLDH